MVATTSRLQKLTMDIIKCNKDIIENVYFDWHLTDWCNFKCSYCPVLDVVTNDFTVDRHANYKMVLARLKNVETTFNVCLTGGEPTLHPNILEILQELSSYNKCQDVAMFTNLSRPVKFFEKIRDINSPKITVMASYHPEYVTDKFQEKCLELSKMIKFSVHVTVHDTTKYWDSTLNFIDFCLANNIKMKPLLLSPNCFYKPNYTPEFFDKFSRVFNHDNDQLFPENIEFTLANGETTVLKSYEVESQGLNKFKGWTCRTMSYSISKDGNVSNTCTGRQVPLLLNNKNVVVDEVCPNDICPGRRLLKFYKYKK